jgi:hypothetical protein
MFSVSYVLQFSRIIKLGPLPLLDVYQMSRLSALSHPSSKLGE